MTTWTFHSDQEVGRYFVIWRLCQVSISSIWRNVIFLVSSPFPHPNCPKKTHRKPAPGKKSKQELETASPRSSSKKVPMQKRCAYIPHHRDTHLHSSPIHLCWLSGTQTTPYSSLSLCKAGGHVQVAWKGLKAKGISMRVSHNMWISGVVSCPGGGGKAW